MFEKTKINAKVAGVGPFFKKRKNVFWRKKPNNITRMKIKIKAKQTNGVLILACQHPHRCSLKVILLAAEAAYSRVTLTRILPKVRLESPHLIMRFLKDDLIIQVSYKGILSLEHNWESQRGINHLVVSYVYLIWVVIKVFTIVVVAAVFLT